MEESNRAQKRRALQEAKDEISGLQRKASMLMRENQQNLVHGNRTQYEKGCRELAFMKGQLRALEKEVEFYGS